MPHVLCRKGQKTLIACSRWSPAGAPFGSIYRLARPGAYPHSRPAGNYQQRSMMGAVFGKINEETPKYTVIHNGGSFEVREYEPSMAAGVPMPGGVFSAFDGSSPFMVLARYIGVFSAPQNVKAEGIAMTSPVLMQPSSSSPPSKHVDGGDARSGEREGEKIAMAATVAMQPGYGDGNQQRGEKIAMASPVLMQASEDQETPGGGGVGAEGKSGGSSSPASQSSTMSFILPSKYSSLHMVPKPTDPRVTVYELPRRKLAVIGFSGFPSKETGEKKEQELLEAVANAGFKVRGKPSLMIYNGPYTLPMFRTNEVAVAVE